MSLTRSFAVSEPCPRDGSNEDYAAVDDERGVFIVADGLGGRPGGAEASRAALERFLLEIPSVESPLRLDKRILRAATAAANHAVRSIAEANPMMTGMGTTLSAVVLAHNVGRIVHVGDSKVYLLRGRSFEQLTKDHTLVAELIARNHMSREGARRYPLRNVLSRSLGTSESVHPDISDISLQPADWLFIATDGLSNALSNEQIAEIACAARRDGPQAVCRALACAALERTGDDSVTVISVEYNGS